MDSDSNYYYNSTGEEEDLDEQIPLKKSVQRDAKLWDSFQDPPSNETSSSSVDTKFIDLLTKLLKIFVYWFVCIVIACSSVLSKISFLLMTSHIKINANVQFCDIKMPEKELLAFIPEEQIIAWKWAIIFAFLVPEAGVWIRAIRICFFKNVRRPLWTELGMVWLMETLHVVGLAILAFKVLPELDSIKGAMLTNCLCLVPSVLCMLSRTTREPKITIKYILDVGSISAQVTGLFIWPLTNSGKNLYLIPISIFCISFHWWENFVSNESPIGRIKLNLSESRFNIYLIVAPWKVFVFSVCCLLLSEHKYMDYFSNFYEGFGNNTISIREVEAVLSESLPDFSDVTGDLYSSEIPATTNIIFWILCIQVTATYVCYIFGKFACKIHIQTFSFSLPISLTVPLTVIALIVVCGLRESNTCVFHGILPDYIFFNMPSVSFLVDFVFKQCSWLSVLWLFSQTWVTRNLWYPKSNRNASTEKLFVIPMYSGLIVDQSMALNRRRDDNEFKKDQVNRKITDPESLNEIDAKAFANNTKEGVTDRDHIPQIFICATMWHETKEELMEFLKSILRLDEDQCARRMAMKYIQLNKDEIDSEYYDLESKNLMKIFHQINDCFIFSAHIFFDDAFVNNKKLCESIEACPINTYVHLLINGLKDAAREVYKVKIEIPPPTKIVCPYGGRLIWTLPGRTKMIAHLKDKNKIRHKKRWSQVMYMYYILGYYVMELDASPERKMVIAQNTYLLALDGDIDFQPKAVRLLVDRMKIDHDLGAACGRIHPVGSGPMVWYQLFEYAIGHWLQKSTEHVIGCVLCSPGCFSLFRGRALMENSVMKKYTTQSDQARHYVQYDQGEDRWLCTLLLKQKYRVEYCAASDAYTHAPEGFNEFYNQRRRWVPSTMANIFDLLGDAKNIVKINNNISRPYIFYQIILMFGTIIGPGTIFLMMCSAILSVFQVSIVTAFIWNIIPLFSFMLICYFCKQKYQLMAAFIISIVYSLIMMAVMISVLIQVKEDGILAPSSLFFLTVALQVIITGLLHPQEIGALACGVVYYITIPCMYMLLTIYSLFNMNDVSWGTRENPQDAPSDISNVDEENDHDDEDTMEDIPLITESLDKNLNLLPDWLYDDDLKDGDTETISAAEEQFWTDLIEKYLKPLDMTPKEKEKVQTQLKTLRDLSVFAFTMANALFVLIILLLQLNKEFLHVTWPYNVKNNIMFDKNSFEITIQREYLELEPISLLFVLFFGVVLVIQFIAMLFHRFATISQILATTQIDWYCSKKVKDTVIASELKENAVDIARYLQKPQPEWDEEFLKKAKNNVGSGSDTIHRLLAQHRIQKDSSNLETNFKRELFREGDLNLGKLKVSRRTINILDTKRKSMAEYRKQKKSQTINHYFTSGQSTYSSLHNWDSDENMSIYQRVSYRPPSPVPSNNGIYGVPTELRGVLKKSTSKIRFETPRVEEIIYDRSIGNDNLSFVNDEPEQKDKQRKAKEIDDIELNERAKETSTYI
ncbi:unnamed protein product [Diamesa hyperborea]